MISLSLRGRIDSLYGGFGRHTSILAALVICALGIGIGATVTGSPQWALAVAAIALAVAVTGLWGYQGIVVALLIATILPLPTVAIKTANFSIATVAAPLILLIGIIVARIQGVKLRVPFVWLGLIVLSIGSLSIIQSWLAWDPAVPIGEQRGSGHRWIGYQIAALFFLLVPFVSFAAGVVYGRLVRIRTVFTFVVLALAMTTIWDLWIWWQHPLNLIDAYATNTRPAFDQQMPVYLVVTCLATAVWLRDTGTRLLAVGLSVVGAVVVFVAYALATWLGLLTGLTLIIWHRWRWRGVTAWTAGLTVCIGIAQTGIMSIVTQRLLFSSDLDRLLLWKAAIGVWQKSPLIGIGPGNLPSYMEVYSGFPLALVLLGYQEAHNTYLELLAEVGAFGLIAVAAFCFLTLRHLLSQPTRPDQWDETICSAAIGMLAATGTMAIFGGALIPTVGSAGWYAIPSVVLLWFMGGSAISRRLRSDPAHDSSRLQQIVQTNWPTASEKMGASQSRL